MNIFFNLKTIIFFSLIIISGTAGAVSSFEGKIINILSGPAYGNGKVYIKVDGVQSTPPPCGANNPSWFVFDGSTDAGKLYSSLILTSYTTNKIVNLQGNDTCNLSGNMTDLSHIWLK